jgi:hypothetical protein
MEAMEERSTNIYWNLVWRVLGSDFSLKPANPYFIKQLPGCKSDVKDAQCLQKYLIHVSFVPDGITQQMRQYTRRVVVCPKAVFIWNSRWTISCSSYVYRDSQNVSLHKITKSIIGGERAPVRLGLQIQGRTKMRHGVQP